MNHISTEIVPGVWMEEIDDGHFVMTEKNGRASVMVHRGPLPKPEFRKGPSQLPPFSVRESGNVGQEILNSDGVVIAWTTDSVTAALICKLLTLSKKVQDKKSSCS